MNNIALSPTDPRAFLQALFHLGVKAAIPEAVMGAHMPKPPTGKTIVVGAGKASAQMARALETICASQESWNSEISGLVVTQYGCAQPCKHIEIVEAAHPVPDDAGLDAAQRILATVADASEDDLVVALISGGGSALLPAPAPGLCLADEQEINRALLASGAPISAMNTVRKMFSTIKGGRLAVAAHPAPIISLIISDVPGDDPALVASGPTIANDDGVEQARAIVAEYALDLPDMARKILDENSNPPPRPGDGRLTGARHEIIASAALSLEAAVKAARQAGCEVVMLSDAIEGEACEVGAEHAALIQEYKKTKSAKPLLVLSGGETSVTIRTGSQKPGKGGRNSEYLLALALGISGLDDVYALAADTDGRDGSEDNAGAFADGSSVARMAEKGVNADAYLEKHDAWTAFNSVDDLLVTGPTGTNVNDFRALLIL